MLLTVDIGNTNIFFGIFDNEKIVRSWRIATDKNKTSNEYGTIFCNLINLDDVNTKKLTGSIISCVVPTLIEVIKSALRTYIGVDSLIVEPGINTSMPILYKNPKEIGADRIANGVAAYNEFKKSVVVVDFGTATTFDCISERGEYTGGCIAPGLQISSEALYSAASKLPKVELIKPQNVIGKTTIESIQSGIIYGYSSLVDGIVRKIQKEMNSSPYVVATGGFASLISSESETIKKVDEFLTLKGLRILYEWNS